MSRFGRAFFAKKPETVARDLLGKFLVRKDEAALRVGMIVETEAYLGAGDLSSHSAGGMTKRNKVMFGPAGFSYVYFTYGMHWLLNFITEKKGQPSGVLIRAVEPIYDSQVDLGLLGLSERKRLGSGPARLTKWLKIKGEQNNLDITKSSELYVTEETKVHGKRLKSAKVKEEEIVAASRIGVDYAKEHKDLPLRFYLRENDFVSKR